MSMLEKAVNLALKYHKGEMYGAVPYAYHLHAVAESIEEKYSIPDPTLLAVAWLHDILEDTECTRQEIYDECGPDILQAVVALSKNCFPTYEQYIYAVRRNPISLQVKIHDTLCNLRQCIMDGTETEEKRKRVSKYAKQMLLLTED